MYFISGQNFVRSCGHFISLWNFLDHKLHSWIGGDDDDGDGGGGDDDGDDDGGDGDDDGGGGGDGDGGDELGFVC